MHMLFIKNDKVKEKEKMNIVLYIIIFIMGTLFGSFYTLAVYRIPRRIDIIYTHSFCPNCNHKLGFFELIPVWSYIFQGGKCKECKQKIRPRYLILEVLSGLVFVLIALGLKLDAYNLEFSQIIKFGFNALYFAAIFIIAGIEKENCKIEKSVLYYSVLVSCAYIIYLCIMVKTSIYRYVMYLVTFIILLIVDSEIQIKQAKSSYFINLLIFIITILINLGEFVGILSIFIVILAILITKTIHYIKNELNKYKKEDKNITQNYNICFLLSIASTMLYIWQLYLK